jgi:tetratricopeptide (TPR) repeat protein
VAHYNLACAESMLGNLDASAEHLELSLAAGFDDAKLLLSDGDLANLRDAGRMSAHMERAKLAVVLGDKASKAIDYGDSVKATKLLAELAQIGSLSPLGPGKLADAFLTAGVPGEALGHFREVVLSGKGVAWGLAGMARAQLALGRLDEARAHLTAAADVGWADEQAVVNDVAFDALRGGPGWSKLVAQVVANSAGSESYDLAGWKLKKQKERHADDTAAATGTSLPRGSGR